MNSQVSPTSVKPRRNITNFIAGTNTALMEFMEKHTYEKLGPSYSGMSFEECERNLILHRMSKKFEIPDDTHAELRQIASIKAMVEYDAAGISTFNPARMDLDPYLRHQLYNIRARLHERISSYRFGCDDFQLPSGETFVSAGGDVSIYAKLRDRSQWVSTHRNFDKFALVCYNSPMLKFAARRHMKMWQAETGRRFATSKMYKKAKALGCKNPGFEIFKAKLRCIVTFSPFARLTTVLKDNDADRVIECECFCNMIVQRAIENGVRDVINDEFGIDLDESQVTHRLLIADLNNVTIDLKNASNSVWMAVVDWFISGTRLHKDICDSRSALVQYSLGKTTEVHRFNMMSPMGNGFTFGVMTLLLLTVCREFDSFAHVFGDDIIVDKNVANDVIALLEVLGFKTNSSKTFIDGNFRESCGGFTCEGKYITSFDFSYATTVVDAIVLCNKVGVIAHSASGSIAVELMQLHENLLKLCPPHLLVEHSFRSNFSALKLDVERTNMLHTKRADDYGRGITETVNVFWGDYFSLARGVFIPLKRLLQLQRKDIKCCTTYKRLVIDNALSARHYISLNCTLRSVNYVDASDKPLKPIDDVSRLFAWFYLYNNRVMAPQLRQEILVTSWSVISWE